MQSPIKRTLLAVMIAGLGASGAALAAPPAAFEQIDKNEDGMISPSEASAVEGLDFTAADTDGDGALSRTEYEVAAGKSPQ